MKLCIVTHKLIKGDGQGRVNYEVAKEAIRRGHDITLVSHTIDPQLCDISKVCWIQIRVENIPTVWLRNLVFSLKSSYWLRKNSCKFDIVKVNGAITQTNSDVNAVHFVHNSWLKSPAHIWQQQKNFYSFYQLVYTATNAFWERQAFQRSKIVVAVSEKVKQELLEIGLPQEKIRVILNGVDLKEFTPSYVDRETLGLAKDVQIALFAGDLRTPRKNLDTVLHALLKVPDLHLAVAGSTDGSIFPAMASKLGLENRVHFLGYRKDIQKIMQAVDLLVFPSRYEACTLVLLEAMASGLPVVTSKTAGGAELVTSDCGIVLDNPEDVEGLSSELRSLSGNPQKLKQMRQAARANAENHGWEKMAIQYLDLFEELRSSC
jgi:glycosyltransferase involved in cell wall biosynthesis